MLQMRYFVTFIVYYRSSMVRHVALTMPHLLTHLVKYVYVVGVLCGPIQLLVLKI